MKESDAEAFAYYEEPSHREPAPGQPRRGPKPNLTQHFPVRFSAPTIEAVRRLADDDGMTVSAWIRRAVDREVAERGGQLSGATDANEQALATLSRLRRNVAELARALEGPGRPVPRRKQR